jgi:hypothetical protein
MEHQASGPLTTIHYFQRYASPERLIPDLPHPDTSMIITIPAYDEPDLENTLKSIASCQSPSCHTEVLVLQNYPENISPPPLVYLPDNLNKKHLTFHMLRSSLPAKKAGVGLARKLIMDEAARRLTLLNRPKGIIAGLDADCMVRQDYLYALDTFRIQEPHVAGASVYYEHPLQGEYSPGIYEAIAEYELHLRYYVHAQRWAGAWYAYQTVGSSMVVRNNAYQKTGGMNVRQAGEDFYFLMKVIPHGFTEIKNTCVYPSPRISNRVPFGTGRAVSNRLINKVESQLTYSPKSIRLIKSINTSLPKIYNNSYEDLHEAVLHYLTSSPFTENLERMREISSDLHTFSKHFHGWFDGFRLMKLLHQLGENSEYRNIPVCDAAQWLLGELGIPPSSDINGLLQQFRNLDREINK